MLGNRFTAQSFLMRVGSCLHTGFKLPWNLSHLCGPTETSPVHFIHSTVAAPAQSYHFTVTFSLPKPSFTIIVLSQVDTRYFKEIAGISSWTLEFALVKRGEKDPLAEASQTLLYSRSVNLEIDLEAGEYVVYVSSLISFLLVSWVGSLPSLGPIGSYNL